LTVWPPNLKNLGAAAGATTRLIFSLVRPEIEVDKVGVDSDGFKKRGAPPVVQVTNRGMRVNAKRRISCAGTRSESEP
jgi:hypothetical protein